MASDHSPHSLNATQSRGTSEESFPASDAPAWTFRNEGRERWIGRISAAFGPRMT
jgi:hypothetical protein